MRRKNNNHAFTLLELLVVISIIVLMLALSVPVVRSIEGSRSVETAYNRLAAALGHARQIALYYRQPAGIAIYYDTVGGSMAISYVSQQNPPTGITPDSRYIDIVPNEESIALPSGIGAQIYNGNGGADKYFSEGVILFDEHGQLATIPYWISNSSSYPRGLGALMGLGLNSLTPTGGPPRGSIYSHSAICLFDQDTYNSQVDPSTGNSFASADSSTKSNAMNTSVYAATSSSPFILAANPLDKNAEAIWLSSNGEMLVIKPNDGSLLKNK